MWSLFVLVAGLWLLSPLALIPIVIIQSLIHISEPTRLSRNTYALIGM